jgi:hypothetical protein
MNPSNADRKNAFIGMLRVARGRGDGVSYFGATPQAFTASLAPLIALPLVSAVLSLATDGVLRALTRFALTLCVLLAPAVISFELARMWGRSELWLRFATAFNWCEWILPLAALPMIVSLSVGISVGMSEQSASFILFGFLIVYGLWLHWFLARKALHLSGGYAVLMVIVVNIGTALTILAPRLLADRIG